MSDAPELTAHWLYAAVNVARTVVGSGGWTAQQLRESYWESPTGGTLGLTDLTHGQQLLEHLGLLAWREGRCYPVSGLEELANLPDDVAMQLLLRRGILQERPLWLFPLIDQDTVHPLLDLPERMGDTLRHLFPHDGELEAELLGLARTVDAELLREIGLAGELHVVDECRQFFRDAGDPALAHLVQRVSAFDDTLGFDITATDRRAVRHKLEVKTTTAAPGGTVTVYLSRNEARVGLANPDWSLVAVRDWFDSAGQRELQTIGWVRAAVLAPGLPSNGAGADVRGQWQSVRLEIPSSIFQPGLPLNQLEPRR